MVSPEFARIPQWLTLRLCPVVLAANGQAIGSGLPRTNVGNVPQAGFKARRATILKNSHQPFFHRKSF